MPARRLEIDCPECGAFIVSVPEDGLPNDGLVCPKCGAVLDSPILLDKLVADFRRKISSSTNVLNKGDQEDN